MVTFKTTEIFAVCLQPLLIRPHRVSSQSINTSCEPLTGGSSPLWESEGPTAHPALCRCKGLHFLIHFSFDIPASVTSLYFFWAFCTSRCGFVAAFFRPAPTAAFKVSITTGAAGGRTGVCDISALLITEDSSRPTPESKPESPFYLLLLRLKISALYVWPVDPAGGNSESLCQIYFTYSFLCFLTECQSHSS